MSITAKLLLWSMTLAGIFSGAVWFLFMGLEEVVQISTGIVNVNYTIDTEISRMIGRLISLLENRKRYNILKKEENADAAKLNLKEYSLFLEKAKEGIPETQRLNELSIELTSQLAAAPADVSPELALPDDTVNRWIDSLSATRQHNREEIQHLLLNLNATGRQAARHGLTSLAIALFLGLCSAGALALRLNHSLTELRRGIYSFSSEGHFVPLRSHSHDELSEIARAFNEMAERLQAEERMRADFISMLSHEIRTPLTSIRESTNLLLDSVFGPLNEKQTHFLEISLKEVDRLTGLLTRLLCVSSLESSKLSLTLVLSDGRLLVKSALERMHGAALSKHITLVADLPSVDCPVLVDLDCIEQALLNLVGNAIKFSPQGSVVRAGVRLLGETDKLVDMEITDCKEVNKWCRPWIGDAKTASNQVVLFVEDQGPGIPTEEQQHVFLKYYRASNIRDSINGAGLGLGISKAIVEAHKGRIWLESTPGHGSYFCFILPSAMMSE